MASGYKRRLQGVAARVLRQRSQATAPVAQKSQPAVDPDTRWFWDHYEVAVDEIASFCREAGVGLAGLNIADVGCGDGIMALGVANRLDPLRVVGFDPVPTDIGLLERRASAQDQPSPLSAALEFRTSSPQQLPAGDEEFDFVYSWSAFEHIAEPLVVLREIKRILRPTGCFFLQLWPFYRSGKGSHLWDWFVEDFHHLLRSEGELLEEMRRSSRHSAGWTEYMAKEFTQLNHVTVEELQQAVVAAGFDVRRLELLTSTVALPPALRDYSWTDLAVGGVKLIATPESRPPT